MTREELDAHMAKLRANPRFKIVEPTGEAFIISGQSPAHPKPAAKATEKADSGPDDPKG
jgi:hypothetical protein